MLLEMDDGTSTTRFQRQRVGTKGALLIFRLTLVEPFHAF